MLRFIPQFYHARDGRRQIKSEELVARVAMHVRFNPASLPRNPSCGERRPKHHPTRLPHTDATGSCCYSNQTCIATVLPRSVMGKTEMTLKFSLRCSQSHMHWFRCAGSWSKGGGDWPAWKQTQPVRSSIRSMVNSPSGASCSVSDSSDIGSLSPTRISTRLWVPSALGSGSSLFAEAAIGVVASSSAAARERHRCRM